jgi:hypothetical protein
MTEQREPLTFEAVAAAFDKAWTRFAAAVDRFPAARVEEAGPDGSWSVKQIAGHVAYWDGFEADNLPRRHEMPEVDWEAMNDANIADLAGRGYAAVLTELDANHRRLANAMRQPHQLEPDHLRELTCDHYDEHAAELEARLA